MTKDFTETQQMKAVLAFIKEHLLTYGPIANGSTIVALDFGDIEEGIHRFRVWTDGRVTQIK